MTRSIWLTDQGSDGMINEIFGFIKKLLGIGMPCAFHSLTGLYCPGCGGTRAVRALLSGHPVLSFLYHPVVPYMASVAVWAAASWILYFATGNRRFRPELDDRIAYAAAGIVILNFIIKNGLLVFAGIDVIGRLPGV